MQLLLYCINKTKQKESMCLGFSSRGGGGGEGRLLVNRVPLREQRTAKLTVNGVFGILKLVPLFTLSSQKVTLSNVVN